MIVSKMSVAEKETPLFELRHQAPPGSNRHAPPGSKAALLVQSGGVAHLANCQVSSESGPGLRARDFSTEATLQDCSIIDCEGPCVIASESASIRLNSCLVQVWRLTGLVQV